MKIPAFLLLLIVCLQAAAQDDYPVPPKPAGHLFYLQHSRNLNTVMYSINLKGGAPDPEKPIKIHWIRYSEQGQVEELSTLQRNYAYGLETAPLGNNSYEINFVSDMKFKMQLRPSSNGYHVYTTINQHPAMLTRIFLEIKGGGLLTPNIEYVQLWGLDSKTGQAVHQRVKIK